MDGVKALVDGQIPKFDKDWVALKKHVDTTRVPAVLQNAEVGPCLQKWTLEYLESAIGNLEAKIHVASNPRMDFLNRNFAYRTLPFSELLNRATEDEHKNYFFDKHEKYYLRSLGNDPRKEVANLKKQFPQLSEDVAVPPVFPEERFFSSILRLSSAGVHMWTHYDIMDNILIQVAGRKRVVLFSPQDAANLYINGDKSEVLDIDDWDADRFPDFSKAKKYEVTLEPGDALFIPALWFHNTKAYGFNIGVNVFWKHLKPEMYDPKDVYGNHDLLPAVQAMQLTDRALKLLETLPDDYKDFYGRLLAEKIKTRTFLKN